MTIEERNAAIIDMLRAYTKKHTRSRKAALAALVAEGIYTPDGELAPEYRGTAEPEPKAA